MMHKDDFQEEARSMTANFISSKVFLWENKLSPIAACCCKPCEMMVRRSESEKKDIKEKVKALDSQVWNSERREDGRR